MYIVRNKAKKPTIFLDSRLKVWDTPLVREPSSTSYRALMMSTFFADVSTIT